MGETAPAVSSSGKSTISEILIWAVVGAALIFVVKRFIFPGRRTGYHETSGTDYFERGDACPGRDFRESSSSENGDSGGGGGD